MRQFLPANYGSARYAENAENSGVYNKYPVQPKYPHEIVIINDSTIPNLEEFMNKFDNLWLLFINYCDIGEIGNSQKFNKLYCIRISYQLMLQISSTSVITLLLYQDHPPGFDDNLKSADLDIIMAKFPNLQRLALYRCDDIKFTKVYPIEVTDYDVLGYRIVDLKKLYNFRKTQALLIVS